MKSPTMGYSLLFIVVGEIPNNEDIKCHLMLQELVGRVAASCCFGRFCRNRETQRASSFLGFVIMTNSEVTFGTARRTESDVLGSNQ